MQRICKGKKSRRPRKAVSLPEGKSPSSFTFGVTTVVQGEPPSFQAADPLLSVYIKTHPFTRTRAGNTERVNIWGLQGARHSRANGADQDPWGPRLFRWLEEPKGKKNALSSQRTHSHNTPTVSAPPAGCHRARPKKQQGALGQKRKLKVPRYGLVKKRPEFCLSAYVFVSAEHLFGYCVSSGLPMQWL